MPTVEAANFKRKCLSLLDRLGPEGIVITKHGKPVAKLIPLGTEPKDLIGALAGKLRIRGKLLSTRIAWRAQSRHSRRGSARAPLA